MVLHGRVQFFTVDEQVSDGLNLVYRLTLLSVEDKTYMLHGYKKIDASMAFSAGQTWKATTTLYTTITDQDEAMVGCSILKISWRNFNHESQSFVSAVPSKSVASKVFGSFSSIKSFAKGISGYFFAPFQPLEFPDKSTTGYLTKPPPPKTVDLVAEDGVLSIIKVWKPAEGARQHETPILFLPGASVDDQIFSLPTIQTNTVDFFTRLGYTCYVAVLRFGNLSAARLGCTAYDARLDVKAAMEFVRNEEQNQKFYVICHCLGSIAVGCALLTGAVDATWMQGMTCSQVFTNLRFGRVNRRKAHTKALERIYKVRPMGH
jgi:hypothetical protein